MINNKGYLDKLDMTKAKYDSRNYDLPYLYVAILEGDFDDFSLVFCRFKHRMCLERKHLCYDIAWDRVDKDIEFSDTSIVISSRLRDDVFDLVELVLEVNEACVGFEIRITLCESEELFEHTAESVIGSNFRIHGSGRDIARSGIDDCFESWFLMTCVAFDGLDEIGDEICPSLELDIDIASRVVDRDIEADEAIIDHDSSDDDEDDDPDDDKEWRHGG